MEGATAMSERKRLADRRHCELVDFESMGLRFTAGIGRYPDGRIAELFLDNHKAGSAIGALVRDAAVILSFCPPAWVPTPKLSSTHFVAIPQAAP